VLKKVTYHTRKVQGYYAVLKPEPKKEVHSEKRYKLSAHNQNHKRNVIAGLSDVQKSGLFYTIMEYSDNQRRRHEPVRSLYPLLSIATAWYYLVR
jgi:hypothetical protein